MRRRGTMARLALSKQRRSTVEWSWPLPRVWCLCLHCCMVLPRLPVSSSYERVPCFLMQTSACRASDPFPQLLLVLVSLFSLLSFSFSFSFCCISFSLVLILILIRSHSHSHSQRAEPGAREEEPREEKIPIGLLAKKRRRHPGKSFRRLPLVQAFAGLVLILERCLSQGR